MTISVPIAMTIPPAKRMICSVGMPDTAFSFGSGFCSVVAGACVWAVEFAVSSGSGIEVEEFIQVRMYWELPPISRRSTPSVPTLTVPG